VNIELCCFYFKQEEWQKNTGKLINGLQEVSTNVIKELELNADRMVDL